MIDISDGIDFACRRCGNCCTIPGFVYLTWEDVTRMCAFLKITEAEFKIRYTNRDDIWTVLKNRADEACIFFEEGTGCRVQDAKPTQCDCFPFWDSALENTASWAETCGLCSGIGDGRHHDEAEIRAQLARQE